MSFIVEDGTGLVNSNSYISVDYADLYFVDRGDQLWSALTTQKKQESLIKATDYIELLYADRFIGVRLTTTQALSWPRVSLLALMPPQLARATCEYAVRASQGALVTEDVKTGNGYVIRKKTQAGPIVNDVSYSSGTSSSNQYKSVPAGDIPISQLCYNFGGGVIR